VTEETPNDMPPPPVVAAIAAAGSNEGALLNVLLTQLDNAEKRLSAKMDANAASAMRRWEHHDIEHRTLSEAVGELKRQFDEHMRQEREEDLVFDARMAPMRRLGYIIGKEWRTIAIAILFAVEFIQRTM
jgi:hypothetical protein